MASDRSLRFGVAAADGMHSPHWTLKVGANRPDVYVFNRGSGSIFHASLHENPDHWHIKARSRSSAEEQEILLHWDPRDRSHPQLVRALNLAVTPAVIDLTSRPGMRTFWYPAPEANQWVHFNVFLQDQAATEQDAWPMKESRGSDLVGWLPLANDWSVCVTAHHEPGVGGQSQIDTGGFRGAWKMRKQLLKMDGANVASFQRLADEGIGIIEGRVEITSRFRSPTWWVRWAIKKFRVKASKSIERFRHS